MMRCLPVLICLVLLQTRTAYAGNVRLAPADDKAGYVARLLINEAPFPGERGWESEADTKAAMLAILWVLHSRIDHIPPGYTQRQIAAVTSKDIIDVITVGGEKGQCDGFYRDTSGNFKAVPRTHQRLAYLTGIAEDGSPGKFARLLNYAQGLASAYMKGGVSEANVYANLHQVGTTPVTGHAYSWMMDQDIYNPGGRFVRIPDDSKGSLGGNRFFTLEKKP